MDFKKSRYYMVEQQIRPWDVLDLSLLNILGELPREKFVPPAYINVAYADMNLPLENGSVMLEPKIVARLIQALDLNENKNVLEIATGSGYATAIMAHLAKEVDTIDIDNEQLIKARNTLESLNITNVYYHHADGLTAATIKKLSTKYDAIYIGGALHKIPDFLITALNQNGKLVGIVGSNPVMHATVLTKKDDGTITKNLFETSVPYLTENESIYTKKFVF